MEDDFVGAIKIKDGLFIGDEYAAQDFEFVVTNKVTHIINCAGKQIPNYWETVGVIYLTFDWLDSENQIVFDTKGEVVNEIFNFIEDAAKLGEGVLVHSIKGQSRSCCVLTAYFMKRYHWSLYKTLEFLTSRRSDLEIRTSFYHQLLNLESRLFQQADGNVTVNWFEMGPENDKEEILLRNTFLNARSAPFDEALVNPQAGVDTRPRTINWGDERPSSKGGLSAFLTKESVAARLSKAPMVSCRSILKGSNKVFKLKMKEEEVVASSSTKGNGSGLRANKSVRNFSEGRNSDAMVDDANTKAIVEKSGSAAEKNSDGKGGKGPNMMRSSSAIYLDKEDNNTRSASTGKGQTNDKSNNAKVSNVNGNIIHLTVNNYIAPVNNQSNTAQTNNFMADESKSKSVAPKTPEPRPASQQKALEAKNEEETNKQAGPVIATTPSGTTSTKGSVSTNYLKSAIEKKLSKEYKSQLSSTAIKGDIQPVTVKTPSGTESKGAKPFKEYAKPSDLKVNYQVLLKNRETPPPRKREEAKRGLDSPNKKAASKSSISTKGTNDSSMPYSSYLNSMFSTSFSQLNTVTPSAYATTGEKKTPISAKAASKMSYNLTLSQKAQTLTRPQRSNAGQIGDKTYGSSVLGSTLSKSKLEPSSATLVGAKFNNYTSTTQTKGNPVRVTYEKIERPHSATPDRSATPQAGARRPGTSSGMGVGVKNDQRFSVPSKNTTKHGKKDSGTTQELLAKHRQRSSSPSPMSYNPALSNSSLSLKSKAKY